MRQVKNAKIRRFLGRAALSLGDTVGNIMPLPVECEFLFDARLMQIGNHTPQVDIGHSEICTFASGFVRENWLELERTLL